MQTREDLRQSEPARESSLNAFAPTPLLQNRTDHDSNFCQRPNFVLINF